MLSIPYKRTLLVCAAMLYVLLFSSCTNTKKATYFYGMKDGAVATPTPVPESIIQKNDILSITVSSLNPEASALFNASNGIATAGGSNGGSTGAAAVGYLVGPEGNIQFPLLGLVKAEGLTKNQLKDYITKTLGDRKLLVDPIITIRFQNFRVTVLGEVNHPSVVSVPNEKLSLLEALGLAGDLTIYGERKNVMIIREQGDQKLIKRINLNSAELFSSPYYYLQSNDIVYVEPNKVKVSSAGRTMQWLPIVISGLSLAVIVADRLIPSN
ncbi:polysaccharide biosynthesis/export family protein [Terrimonas ferruginea]|uniref:polysaccharide biosynthesis/export family protein n=1 Tax=Terrimonas ferruginea TaxID=249 RepID=UPI00040790B8|nr:polysaccharide biosynthesis/export family protein [Terrimonas ferruginea]